MIPREFFTTEAALFKDMSSDADEEDWTTIQASNRSRKRAKTEDKRHVAPLVGLVCNQPLEADTSENRMRMGPQEDVGSRKDPTRKKPRLTHQNTRRSSQDSDRLVQPASQSLPTPSPGLSVADLCPEAPIISDAVATAPKKAAHALERTTSSGVSLHGDTNATDPSPSLSPRLTPGEIPSLDTEGVRPIARSATTSSTRVISKEALLRRSCTSSSTKQPAGRRRKSHHADNDGTKKKGYSELVIELMARLSQSTKRSRLFSDCRLFLVTLDPPGAPASEQTRRRLDFLLKHGVVVEPAFDSTTTTHIIICDLAKAQVGTKATIKRHLGGMAVEEVPSGIRIVPWKWVTDSVNKGHLVDQMKAELYVSRVHAALKASVKLQSTRRVSRGVSPIEDLTESQETQERLRRVTPDPPSPEVLPTPECSPRRTSAGAVDPLAPYYDDAVYGHGDEDELDDAVADTSEKHEPSSDLKVRDQPGNKYKGYVCNEVGRWKGPGLNDDIIEKLQELMHIHETSRNPDDKWKVQAYRKAIRSLRRSFKRITKVEEARKLPGIGEKTANKASLDIRRLSIAEIVRTGELRRLGYERTEERAVCLLLCGIYGVGPKIAYNWYQRGIRTLDDVRERKNGLELTDAQKIGLEHYDDLQHRMPRAEAAAIFDKIKSEAFNIDPRLRLEIMGSYRRGSPDCGDIDILLTRPADDGRSHKGVLPRLLHALFQRGIITHTLGEPDYSGDGLEAKFMGLCRVDASGRYRRIGSRETDILGFALTPVAEEAVVGGRETLRVYPVAELCM
ncbi:hypothetical protein FRB99_002975 [Tulasnella sp. 403]|nr:hypothetical protein FRB99_002975 [Tulasnella sp. 403]